MKIWTRLLLFDSRKGILWVLDNFQNKKGEAITSPAFCGHSFYARTKQATF